MLSKRRKAHLGTAEESNSQNKKHIHPDQEASELSVTSESIRPASKSHRAKKIWISTLSAVLTFGIITVMVANINTHFGDFSGEDKEALLQNTVEKNQVYYPFNRTIRVACIGDSLTLGEIGTSPGDSYPSQLQKLLGDGFVTNNYGVNSVTATRGLQKSYNLTQAFQDSIAFNADIYLLMLGTNDCKFWARRSKEFGRDMEWIVNQVTRRIVNASSPATRIIVAIPPWVKGDYGGIKNDIIVNNVQPAIRQFAATKRLQLVDMYEVTLNQNDFYIGDNLHLNAKGYQSLAQAWKRAIECSHNDVCDTGENCLTCPQDCHLNCT